jgi:site-specific recombinase XerC
LPDFSTAPRIPASGDDIRRFQLAQVEQGAQPPKMNTQASALRFFFTITLGRADLAHQLARTHYPRKLPRVLAREQVARLIEAAPGPGLKYKTALSIAYGAGLSFQAVDGLGYLKKLQIRKPLPNHLNSDGHAFPISADRQSNYGAFG